MTKRFLTEVSLRCIWKYVYNFALKGFFAGLRFRKTRARGEYAPPFWFISVTDNCNLKCQGCWVNPDKRVDMPASQLDRIINEGKSLGNRFFGILGGEPLMHPELFDILEKHSDCYFQLLTNGTLLTDEVAQKMRSLGNITPLISVEGDEDVSDIRRGGDDVYSRSLEGVKACSRAGLITGVATSVCKSNFDALVTDDHLQKMADLGAHYAWYYIYRPVGPDPQPELSLDKDQILALRKFMVEKRPTAPLAIVDSYWDADGKAFCPAALGLSIHINARGDIEPCPPIQFACESFADENTTAQTVCDSAFLKNFKEPATKEGDGCILMQSPKLLNEYAAACNATDTSGRDGVSEISKLQICACHDLGECEEIPETHFLYRLGKKHWFFGIGAYG